MKQFSLIITTFILTLLTYTSSAQDIIMVNGTQSVCAGTFLDPGGNNDYASNSDFEMTLCSSTAGQEISVTFTMFNFSWAFWI